MERHSRYLLVLPLLDATTLTVVAAVTAAFQQLRPTMRRSLTWDRGVEMTRHTDFTAATGIPVYFCDAYCPWQRGSNENSNGLLRQYFPKKTDLSQHDADHVHAVVNELNSDWAQGSSQSTAIRRIAVSKHVESVRGRHPLVETARTTVPASAVLPGAG